MNKKHPQKMRPHPSLQGEEIANAAIGAAVGGLIAGPAGLVMGGLAGALIDAPPDKNTKSSSASNFNQDQPNAARASVKDQTREGIMLNETETKKHQTERSMNKTMKENKITSLLIKAYAAELETVQNYLANSVWLDGLRAHEVAEALAQDVTDELGHAQLLAQRLKQLGACPPGSLELVRNQNSLQPAKDSTDLRHVVEGALEYERVAIVTYQEIYAAGEGVDPVTQDLVVKILADEERHRTLLEGFLRTLNKNPSGQPTATAQ